jgi:hypothetical protein
MPWELAEKKYPWPGLIVGSEFLVFSFGYGVLILPSRFFHQFISDGFDVVLRSSLHSPFSEKSFRKVVSRALQFGRNNRRCDLTTQCSILKSAMHFK